MFDRHVPLKEKHVRCNQAAFVNKNRRKTIMTRSRLLNKFRHERTISSHVACKNNKICVKLLQKTKANFFNKHDVKRVTDNEKFWKTVILCKTYKTLKNERKTLIENEEVASDVRGLVKIFNEYF